MSMRETLDNDLKEAMKGGDALKRDVIRNIRTIIKETEQSNKEALTKKALEKHGVKRPQKQDDPVEMAAYEKAVDAAVAAEKVNEAALLDDTGILVVIQKLVKQRQDSIDDASKAGRQDIVEAETAELGVLTSYLPKQLSREEIAAEARAIIADTGAASAKDIGKVMGPLTAKLKGKADGKLINEVVRELLQ